MHQHSIDTHTPSYVFMQTPSHEGIWYKLSNKILTGIYVQSEWALKVIPLDYWKERLQAAYFILFTLQTVKLYKGGCICWLMLRSFTIRRTSERSTLHALFCFVYLKPLWRFHYHSSLVSWQNECIWANITKCTLGFLIQRLTFGLSMFVSF